MKRVIEWCIDNKSLVLILTVTLTILGIWSMFQIKLDAIPDLSDTQVIVKATYTGQPPQVVEDQVTYPITSRMLSVPYAKDVRGYSYFGFSLIYVIFEDGTDLYWARTRVLEYLNGMQGQLPQGVSMELGPDSTSIGWIYQYALVDHSGRKTLADLRDLQDFILKNELTAVQGVSEVATLGGFKRQFQIEVDPNLLLQYNIPLSTLEEALRKSNKEMGARLIEQGETEYMILSRGYIKDVKDIESIPIRRSPEGAVLRMKDIAHVQEGPDIRRGIADLDGKGEVVGAIVIMRQGEDVPRTIERIKNRLNELQSTLPQGVHIVTTYDRSDIIDRAVSNLRSKLIQELIIVAIITIFFLLHFRSALVALVVLPLGILTTMTLINILGISANIMSMGGIAIAIGVMVDASVVMVENTHKHLEVLMATHGPLDDSLYWKAAREATAEVGPGLFWSMIIIVVSFLPVFALPEQSGRLFVPLALTKTLAMLSGAILAVVLLPILVGYFVRGNIPKEENNPVSNWLIKVYKPVLSYALDHKKKVLIISITALIISIIPSQG